MPAIFMVDEKTKQTKKSIGSKQTLNDFIIGTDHQEDEQGKNSNNMTIPLVYMKQIIH